ncbi:hypothetical protein [Undibacterium griseum]|uniref:Uncharacterized protein n=1 Tax=Undibacterium griseum TaxID=2762295 RepID=A0ABR6YNN0_9BURK|nr:hypothetical protein [Undibacterium griseum]MBC3885501.1 hypothetical protein [Undibacterium griseum]
MKRGFFDGLLIILLRKPKPDSVIVMNDFTAGINRECLSVAGLTQNISGAVLMPCDVCSAPQYVPERQAVSVRETLPAVAYLG